MSKLSELIERDNLTGTFLWTHEISTGQYSEHEVWDLVLVRDTHEPQRWVTGGDTRRTAYLRGIEGAEADSRRQTGGERRAPDLAQVLGDLLADANEVDNQPVLLEWIKEAAEFGSTDYDLIERRHRFATEAAAQLRHLLHDEYDEYMTALDDSDL
jgi:hypothetical protein